MKRIRDLFAKGRRKPKSITHVGSLQTPPPKLPTLPSIRPRALSEAEVATQTSPLFTKLPLELRLRIYDFAFNNRTIHIDLDYRQADVKGDLHANLSHAMWPDRSTPKQWRWWSCVCHRYQREKDGEMQILDFWLDRCRNGTQTYCQLERMDRSECFVGVLGWLQSCRQAYGEAISRLYSTNTFYIGELDCQVLFQILKVFILPRRLGQIRRLELLWTLPRFGPLAPDQESEFKRRVSTLTTDFTNLEELKLAVNTALLQPPQSDAGIILNISDPIDSVLLHYGKQLRSCELIIPETHYRALRDALGDGEAAEVSANSTSFRKFYRRVGSGDLGYWVGYLPDPDEVSFACNLGRM